MAPHLRRRFKLLSYPSNAGLSSSGVPWITDGKNQPKNGRIRSGFCPYDASPRCPGLPLRIPIHLK